MIKRDKTPDKFWVTTVELHDLGKRRHPDLPWVFLTYSASDPQRLLERLNSHKSKHWAKSHAKRILHQFSSGPFKNKNLARKAKVKTQRELSANGYTVNRDQTIWSVYVIEMDQQQSPDPSRPYVYVGETTLTPEERFKQHIEGGTNKRGTIKLHSTKRRHLMKKLRYDLFPPDNISFTRAQSVQAEQRWIRHLKSLNYQVEGGHKTKQS